MLPMDCESSNEEYTKKIHKLKRRKMKRTKAQRDTKPSYYFNARAYGFGEFLSCNMHLYGEGGF